MLINFDQMAASTGAFFNKTELSGRQKLILSVSIFLGMLISSLIYNNLYILAGYSSSVVTMLGMEYLSIRKLELKETVVPSSIVSAVLTVYAIAMIRLAFY